MLKFWSKRCPFWVMTVLLANFQTSCEEKLQVSKLQCMCPCVTELGFRRHAVTPRKHLNSYSRETLRLHVINDTSHQQRQIEKQLRFSPDRKSRVNEWTHCTGFENTGKCKAFCSLGGHDICNCHSLKQKPVPESKLARSYD